MFAFIGSIISGIVSFIGGIGSAVGAVIGTTAGTAVAVGVSTAVATGLMQKKAQKKALSIQEEATLKAYKLQDRELARREQEEINRQVAEKESLILSAKAQQIETLANLKMATSYMQPAQAPQIYTTPQPVSQRIGFFETINTAIDKFFGRWR